MTQDVLFETKRLRVRKLTLSDLPAFHEMQRNPRVMQFTGSPPMSLTENKIDLNQIISRYNDREASLYVWAVTVREDAALVGTCALVKEDEGQFEIGVRLLERHWRKGFGQEITKNLLCFAFAEWQARACVGYIMKDNLASIKMTEKYLEFDREYYNEEEQVIDRIYRINREGLLAKGVFSRLI